MTTDFVAKEKEVRELMAQLHREIPQTMQGFFELHKAAVNKGALSVKQKELIAMAIGITVRCDGCIAFHVKSAMDAGASRQEVVEAIGVAVLMGGGPSVVYGGEAMEALRQLKSAALV